MKTDLIARLTNSPEAKLDGLKAKLADVTTKLSGIDEEEASLRSRLTAAIAGDTNADCDELADALTRVPGRRQSLEIQQQALDEAVKAAALAVQAGKAKAARESLEKRIPGVLGRIKKSETGVSELVSRLAEALASGQEADGERASVYRELGRQDTMGAFDPVAIIAAFNQDIRARFDRDVAVFTFELVAPMKGNS